MLPTIDISLIGILLAVWNVVKVIWDYTTKAFMWIMHQALALLIGSKFWATAAFLTVALILVSALSTLLSSVIDYLLSLSFATVNLDSDFLQFLGFFIDGSSLTFLFSYCVSCAVVYQACISLDFTRRVFERLYGLLAKGWKV